jgi:hypothetical protein
MTRFTAGLMQVLIIPVALIAVILTAYLGLNGINTHDWRYLLAGLAFMFGFFGLVKLFQFLETTKR